MSKTFTCHELGGTCEQTFTGNTLMEIAQQAMGHMQADAGHMERIKNLEKETGETKEQWFARMQKEFDKREENK